MRIKGFGGAFGRLRRGWAVLCWWAITFVSCARPGAAPSAEPVPGTTLLNARANAASHTELTSESLAPNCRAISDKETAHRIKVKIAGVDLFERVRVYAFVLDDYCRLKLNPVFDRGQIVDFDQKYRSRLSSDGGDFDSGAEASIYEDDSGRHFSGPEGAVFVLALWTKERRDLVFVGKGESLEKVDPSKNDEFNLADIVRFRFDGGETEIGELRAGRDLETLHHR